MTSLPMELPAISVGLLTADLGDLRSQVALMEQAGVSLLHFDVMDGCFVPMMTFGPPIVKAVQTALLKDVHLMIRDPLEKLEQYVAAGADIVTVHAESCIHIHRVLQGLGTLRNANAVERPLWRGVALNPGTPVETIEPLLEEVDILMLLAVNPGWGGQNFITATEGKLVKARKLIEAAGRRILLALDGGITRDNIGEIGRMGADILVTGSAVFDGKTPVENVQRMMLALRAAV